MKRIIASIKLAPGNRGFFDPLTGINLSVSNNVGYIREDDNISNIRKAIKESKIKIVGGQLPPAITIKPVEQKPVKEIDKDIKPEKKKEIKRKVVKEKKNTKKVEQEVKIIKPIVEAKEEPSMKDGE